MKIILLGIILVLVMVGVGYCQDEQPLQLIISSDKQAYEVGEEVWIQVAIKNVSGRKYSLSSLGFEISSSNLNIAIYSPVKFSDNAFDDTPNDREMTNLQSKEDIILKYNLYNLKWDFILSSMWASKSLITYIQPEKYSISFEVNGKPKDYTSEYVSFTSNTIAIEVVDVDMPASGMASKAKVIAKEYLSNQSYKDEYEEKASSVREDEEYVDVMFQKKMPAPPGDGFIRVDKETWNAEWITED